MTEVKLVKLRLKEGNEHIWFEWCEELKQRRGEVMETLRNEGVLSESCFLSEDEKCVYYFMEAESFEKAKATVEKSTFRIDTEHGEKRALSLEKSEQLSELFHFEVRP